jgi:predicted Zn-dependent peptidase
MYQISRLKNGMTVATAEMPHMASTSLGVWVGVGGRYEPAPVNGVCHFIEHMVFKGTQRRTAREISAAVEGIGGYLNAFTGEESTCFYARASHEQFSHVLEVIMDMFLNSRFAPEDIEKERGVVKEEIAMYLDQPHQHVQELLNETMWPDHPLGRPLTGTPKTLDALTRKALIEYQQGNYNARTTLVTAAGNIGHRELVSAVARYAKHVPEGKRPSFLPADPSQDRPRIKLFTKATAQMQIAMAFRLCSRHDDRRFPLRVLNAVLGDNMSSRLFQSLREDHGLAYSIHSSVHFFEDTGALTISAGLDTDNLSKAMDLIRRELRRCSSTLLTVKELRQARDYLIGQLDLTLENTENHMMWVGDHLLGYGKVHSREDIAKRVSAVTAAQVRAVAREFLIPERLSVAMVSPLKDDRVVARAIERGF